MPRTGRNKSKTKIYHLILRGINKQTIFEDDEDRIKLIQTLQECKNRSENGANVETKGTVPAVCLSQNIDFFHA